MIANTTVSANSSDMYTHNLSVAPTDRCVSVPVINNRYITFEEYKGARCSALLSLHYENIGSLLEEGVSLAEMLEKGYEKEVLRPSMLRD